MAPGALAELFCGAIIGTNTVLSSRSGVSKESLVTVSDNCKCLVFWPGALIGICEPTKILRKVARMHEVFTRLDEFFWNHFRLRILFKAKVRMHNRETTPL